MIVRIRNTVVLILTFQGLRGAQPDGLNSEYCVAVLNDIYKVRHCIIISRIRMAIPNYHPNF